MIELIGKLLLRRLENPVERRNMITIRDVASKAEVSIATVSRVVNGNRPVHPAIRERVLKAVEELNYRPNYLARGLRQRNTCMIGLITPDNSNPFYAEVARAIEDAGFAAGYSVILCNTDLSGEKQNAYLDVLLSHKVDGMILINIGDILPEGLENVIAEHIPIIHMNLDKLIPSSDLVMVDNYQGGYLAGQYLLSLNHRRIGCISFAQSDFYEKKRVVGFRQALIEGGIELSIDTFTVGNGRYDSGYKAMQELIERHPDLTAVFVFNDLMALGAMNAVRALGKQVPDDISIIGFDDILYASIVEPGLTTIAQPITAMGQAGMTQLLERIQQPEKPPSLIVLPVKLVERASCRRL